MSYICKEGERVTVVTKFLAPNALGDMLRYDGLLGTSAEEYNRETGLFTGTYRLKHYTPERWASMGFESAVAYADRPLAVDLPEPLDTRPCKTCGEPEAGHTDDGYCLNRRRPSYEPA
jgi:hypothetical protein